MRRRRGYALMWGGTDADFDSFRGTRYVDIQIAQVVPFIEIKQTQRMVCREGPFLIDIKYQIEPTSNQTNIYTTDTSTFHYCVRQDKDCCHVMWVVFSRLDNNSIKPILLLEDPVEYYRDL
ncbi:hypothetical protein J6590_062138 [Homalodisca vitripennis]|nr:hypothetical protein J6590_062138 [Homalodisca vitripennis]